MQPKHESPTKPKQQPSSHSSPYQVIQVISKTQARTISLIQNRTTTQYFISKQTPTSDLSPSQLQSLNNQITLLKQLRHPNVVKLHQVSTLEKSIVCVMEYCEEGDLGHHIKRQARKGEFFSQEIVESWVLQVLLALEYLHNLKIVHRNLKPSNVFLTSSGNVKVGSFEFSRLLKNQGFAMTFAGTPNYMSPQILENKNYGFPTDIWSLGCIIYQLCCLKPAFSSPNLLQLANKIIRGEPDSTIPSHYSRPLMEIIKRCLSKRPADRPTARQLLRSQFFLTAMQKFIKLNGIVSEKEQKNIPIKKYKVHKGKELKKEGKEIRDPRDRDGGKSTGNISKKKVEPLAVEVKKERNGSRELKREDSKKGIKSPVIQPKTQPRRSSKDIIRRSSSHQKKRSIQKKKPPATPQIIGKVQGKKMKVPPNIPKSNIKKTPNLSRTHDVSQQIEQVSRSANSQIKSPSKEQSIPSIQPVEQQHWMDHQDIDYTLSMTKKNLANELVGFRKPQSSEQLSEPPLLNANPASSFIFETLAVREEEDVELELEPLEQEQDVNRLTMTGNQLPEMLTQYKSKLEEVIQELNYRYGPNMEIIVQRTNEFDSNQFAKNKPQPQ